jgi:hypothetical protein
MVPIGITPSKRAVYGSVLCIGLTPPHMSTNDVFQYILPDLVKCCMLRGRISKGLLQRIKGYSSVESTIRGILFGTLRLIYFNRKLLST